MHGLLHGCVAAIAIILSYAAPALAQPMAIPPDTPKELLREAFDIPFARALIGEFNTRVRQHADAACLRAKPITSAQLAEQGEVFVRTWGLRALEEFYIRAGDAAYLAAVEATLGPNAKDELVRLSAEPEVVRYRAIDRPQRLTFMLYFVFDAIDSYLALNRIKMKPVSPLWTGDVELLNASPVEKVQDALFEFLETNKSASLERYLKVSQIVEEDLRTALKSDAVRADILLKGADRDFQALCILSEIAK